LGSRSLVFRIHLLGLLVLVTNAATTISSSVLAAGLWRKEGAPKAAAFFERLLGELPFVGSPQSLFAANWQVILSHFIPLAIVSLVCMALLIILPRIRDEIDDRAQKLIAELLPS